MLKNLKQPMIYGFRYGKELRKIFHDSRVKLETTDEIEGYVELDLLDVNLVTKKISKKTVLHDVISNIVCAYFAFDREDIKDHTIHNVNLSDALEYFDALYNELNEYTICDFSYRKRLELKFETMSKIDNYEALDEIILEEFDIFVEKFNSILDYVIDEIFSILFLNIHFLYDFNFVMSKIALKPKTTKARRTYVPTWLKTAIIFRDKGRCQYCGKDISNTISLTQPRDVQLDHIIPLDSYGNNDPTNFQLTCSQCNQSKSTNIKEPKGFNNPWW